MQNKIEIFNNQVIINYNLAYPKSREVLLKSHTFAKFVLYLIEYLGAYLHGYYLLNYSSVHMPQVTEIITLILI